MRAWTFCLALAAGAAGAHAEPPGYWAGEPYRLPVRSQTESRFPATLHQQRDFSCGSAAIATLLTYHYGQPVSEASAFAEMWRHGEPEKIRAEGFSLLDMKRFLAARGFEADGFELPLEKLLEARVPAIVLIGDGGYHHFVVVKGVRAGRVLLGDPSAGTRLVSREQFERLWKNRILFVIHNRQELATFNTDSDWHDVRISPVGDAVLRDSLVNVALRPAGTVGP